MIQESLDIAFANARPGHPRSGSGFALVQPVCKFSDRFHKVAQATPQTLLFILLIFFLGCSQNNVSPISGGPIKPLIMEGFTMTETENGKKRLVVIAENAEIDKNNKIIRANKINLRYYNEKGNVVSTLISLRGTLEIGTNDMEAEGNVVLTTDIGARLETEKLKLISATNKVFTDALVRFTKGSNVLTGKGLEADSRLENAIVKEAVTHVTDLKELDMTKKKKKR